MQSVTSVTIENQSRLSDAEYARLGRLVNTESLGISRAEQLTSIAFAADLPKLQILRIDDTGLTSLAGIESLNLLRTLFLRGNPALASAEPVRALSSLETVQLETSSVSSLAPFNNKDSLRSLTVTRGLITSIDIANLPALEELIVSSNQITSLPDFSAAGMPLLHHLSVTANNLTDLEGLEDMNLLFLSADRNRLTTIHHIADLQGVETLYLNDNQLSDITPLRTVTWAAGADVYLGTNCIGVLYFPPPGVGYTLPEGENNETWKQLLFEEGVNVHLGPVAEDNRCSDRPG